MPQRRFIVEHSDGKIRLLRLIRTLRENIWYWGDSEKSTLWDDGITIAQCPSYSDAAKAVCDINNFKYIGLIEE